MVWWAAEFGDLIVHTPSASTISNQAVSLHAIDEPICIQYSQQFGSAAPIIGGHQAMGSVLM